MSQSLTLPALSLYIHIPWCARKCPYCDFNSHQSDAIPEQSYTAALLQDLELDLALSQGRKLSSIFIGGGTPSLFSANAIDTLLKGVASKLEFSETIEITMEANPGSAEAQRFDGYRKAGVNRLSIGVQSFADDKLKELGRIHSGAKAIAAVDMARAAGFDNINLDLMHGLPKQSSEDAQQDIHQAIELNAQHISWYQLTIEANTEFFKRPPTLPDEDHLEDIQQAGLKLLASNNYKQYEVSAYAQPGCQSKHNNNYWSFGDYLGIGAGAHSKITQIDPAGGNLQINRHWKRRQPEQYLTDDGKFIAGSRLLDREEKISEFMMNSLRLNGGFSFVNFENTTGLSADMIDVQIQRLKERQLVLNDGAQVSTTALGQRFLNTVLEEFFDS